MYGTLARALSARKVEFDPNTYTADVLGTIEGENNQTIRITKIHVVFHIPGIAEDQRAAADRAVKIPRWRLPRPRERQGRHRHHLGSRLRIMIRHTRACAGISIHSALILNWPPSIPDHFLRHRSRLRFRLHLRPIRHIPRRDVDEILQHHRLPANRESRIRRDRKLAVGRFRLRLFAFWDILLMIRHARNLA